MTVDTTRAELLADVLGRYETMEDSRLHDVVTAAIRHLHAFVAEVGLTHDEWMAGIGFLTAVGQMCDEHRQEHILLSDTLGVSMLVELIDDDGGVGATENTVLGPFYVPGSPDRGYGESTLEDADEGDRVVVRGRVTDPSGTPIAGATIDVWQNATNGFYAVQQPGIQHPDNLRGVFTADGHGRYELRAVRPVPYPVPGDGPVGALLRACGRDVMRAGHLHVLATAPGHKTLITHLFDESSDHLDDDAVFGVRPSLIRSFAPDAAGELATTFDIVLSPTA